MRLMKSSTSLRIYMSFYFHPLRMSRLSHSAMEISEKPGYNEEVDRLRDAKTKGKTWLAELEAGEREKTGIKNLRIKYNKVFGYYLEVTNSFKDMVPDYYVRKKETHQCRALHNTGA